MQPLTRHRRRSPLHGVRLSLPPENRTRLVEALRRAKTLEQAARLYGMTNVHEFRRLAVQEGFRRFLAPLIYPLRYLSLADHRRLLRLIQQGRPPSTIAKQFGVRRQAIEQRIQRLGLWGAYKAAREAVRLRGLGMWDMLSEPPYVRLRPIAAALAARGVTVGCVPIFSSNGRRVVDCRLTADGAPVRVLRPGSVWQGRYRVSLLDQTAHYVVEVPTGERVWYAIPHRSAPVFIPAEGAAVLLDRRHPPTAVWHADDHPDPWADASIEEPVPPELAEETDHAVCSAAEA